MRLYGPLNTLCEALMEPERVKLIAPNRDGEALYDAFGADGYLSVHAFLEWWIAQNQAIKVTEYMSYAFPDSILLERSSAFSFRFRITTPDIPLATIFSKFESDKESLLIEDYSVGQTTLEQIFNQFAASQNNPEVTNVPLDNTADCDDNDDFGLKRTDTLA